MITVTFGGEQYECATAIKGDSYIRLYDADGVMQTEITGISTFDGVTIEGGSWRTPPATPEEVLATQLTDLQMALAEVYELVLTSGGI